jgi:hypothetical protein
VLVQTRRRMTEERNIAVAADQMHFIRHPNSPANILRR